VREGGEHSGVKGGTDLKQHGGDEVGKATGRKGTGGNIEKGEHVGALGR
jgi:hypothetical protein